VADLAGEKVQFPTKVYLIGELSINHKDFTSLRWFGAVIVGFRNYDHKVKGSTLGHITRPKKCCASCCCPKKPTFV